jgi:hypothetical protein
MFALNMANAALCVIGILLFNGTPIYLFITLLQHIPDFQN